ncbi:MAG: replicative DNA helicase [Candidatus Competibacteraceae bacterium]|nr:replicative DNA helicase [Candidatus Competibacteraceae bacterium]
MEQGKTFTDKTFKPRKKATEQPLDFGKVPPQAVDLEEAVLGAIMLEKNAFTQVNEVLKPEIFYKPAHRMIYEAIQRLFMKMEPIDILTVTQELKEKGQLEIVGGPYFIASLTSRVGSAANIESHCKLLQEKFIKRELIRISGDVITEAFEESTDAFDVLDKAEQGLFDVSQGNLSRTNVRISDLLKEAISNMENAAKNDSKSVGVPSGFHELDKTTSGWQPSNLIVVAARPGMGKTAFALSLARNAAIDFKKPVAIFSLEMDAIELVNRLISSEATIDSSKIKSGQLTNEEWDLLHANLSKLAEAPIFINDTPALSISDFRAIARRLHQHNRIELIVIDYLQLMRGSVDTRGLREQEISFISRSLKAVAKELKIPIIALSQLSRKVEERGGDKKPLLSDLRESGAIEQDADMVCFIYRPDYYEINHDEEGNSLKGIAQILIAKNRHGRTTDVNLGFVHSLTKFVNIEDLQFHQEKTFKQPSSRIVKSKNWDNAFEDTPF